MRTRRRQGHLAGQVGKAHAAIVLQQRQDFQVDRVERNFWHNSPFSTVLLIE
jgi:hypothetical protein